MRYLLIAWLMLLCPLAFTQDDLNIKVETRGDDVESSDDDVGPSDEDAGVESESPGAEAEPPASNIDIGVTEYPEMVPVPGYPVYYNPHANLNYFFYDGLYWVYWEDTWYASSWYNGPWQLVAPVEVPLFVLRVPVRYYRQPPRYFHYWRADAPPRWGEHWGHDWEDHRRGWDRWDRHAAPHIAPLPVYQRVYSGDRYPHEAERRHSIRSEYYHYQPREAVTQRHYIQPRRSGAVHFEPHEHEPVLQRSATHEHGQLNQQPRHLQPANPQLTHPVKQTPQSQPMHQTQTVQPAPHLQHTQSAPHDTGRENKHEEHGEEHR